MKTVILAGGRGTRLQELTGEIPKPMIEIGGEPMLRHIMGIYARQGFSEFVIAGGYLIDVIGAWLDRANLPWTVNLIDTGIDTLTGGRIAKLRRYLSDQFFLTYGDGVADIDLRALIKFHDQHKGFCTFTAVHPPARWGEVELQGSYCTQFTEKKRPDGWVNGGFMLCEPEAFNYIQGDEPFETGAMTRMALAHVLTAYRHESYWQCMDTLRDVETLREDWEGKRWTGQKSE